MTLVRAGELVREAAGVGRAVAAFNIITLEHAEAVVAGAEAAGLPVILQLSENAVKFRDGRLLPISRAAAACAEAATVPVGLHLDHVKSPDLLRQACDAGYSSVMYDAAQLPYAENLEATRSAADWAHANGLWIEAELGEVGGKNGAAPPDPHAPGARTDPDEARRFVADSGVDDQPDRRPRPRAAGEARQDGGRTARPARLVRAAGLRARGGRRGRHPQGQHRYRAEPGHDGGHPHPPHPGGPPALPDGGPHGDDGDGHGYDRRPELKGTGGRTWKHSGDAPTAGASCCSPGSRC